MTKDPWTDRDPQPGDFDGELAAGDNIETHEGDPAARLTIVVDVSGEDATRLERIARLRGKAVGEVISELLREAEQHAA